VVDPLWLGRIVANLVDNAAKFTPPGGHVEVRVAARAATASVLVEDTAPRLGDEERRRVFERFYRGDAVRGTTEGFGLGLALASDMARAMGAELRCEPGTAGNRFSLHLPRSEGGRVFMES
jgi:signal transduction histidine kinase